MRAVASAVACPWLTPLREMSLDGVKMQSMMEQILADAAVMADQGVPLALGWWQQLGRTPALKVACLEPMLLATDLAT